MIYMCTIHSFKTYSARSHLADLYYQSSYTHINTIKNKQYHKLNTILALKPDANKPYCSEAVLRWGGGNIPICCPPKIQKLANRSDMISEVQKYFNIQIFRGSVPNHVVGAYSAPPEPLADKEGARCPSQEPHPRSRPFGPHFYGSQGLTHYRVGNPINDNFKCRPIRSSYFSGFREWRKYTL